MTDKAIAHSRFLTDVTTAAGLLEHGKQSKKLAKRIGDYAFELRQQSAQPDCRTCKYGDTPDGPNDYKWGCLCVARVCTNGNQYIKAPPVVLWRTDESTR